MKTYPLKFRPIFKERIWGGQDLKTAFDKAIPADVKIGESWELADLPLDKSQIVNGEFAGETIDAVLNKYPEEFTGDANYRGPFQMLIKILDAQQDLSLQVHPDLETCKKTGKGDPKTECWYIVAAKPGASIYKGLKPGVTREKFEQAVKDGSCAELLEKIEVNVGDCHFLPSGTAHAIGAGLLIAEIQQPSDTTYRVFDWNRVDSVTGKPRELHIEDAIESTHFDSSKDCLSVENSGRLVSSPEFKVDKGEISAGNEDELPAKKMEVILIISGGGEILCDEESYDFAKGDTLFIPFAFNGTLKASLNTEFLRVTL